MRRTKILIFALVLGLLASAAFAQVDFSRYVSLASICAAVTMPIATWFMAKDRTLFLFTVIVGAVIIYKHRSNIQRLLAGTENRIGRRKETGGKGAVA